MTDAVEVGSATAGNWFPSSVDFQVTAMRSGMASGASSLADMINIIARQAAGSISLLGLIGHAADGPRTFGFSGRMTTSPPYCMPAIPAPINRCWRHQQAFGACADGFESGDVVLQVDASDQCHRPEHAREGVRRCQGTVCGWTDQMRCLQHGCDDVAARRDVVRV